MDLHAVFHVSLNLGLLLMVECTSVDPLAQNYWTLSLPRPARPLVDGLQYPGDRTVICMYVFWSSPLSYPRHMVKVQSYTGVQP